MAAQAAGRAAPLGLPRHRPRPADHADRGRPACTRSVARPGDRSERRRDRRALASPARRAGCVIDGRPRVRATRCAAPRARVAAARRRALRGPRRAARPRLRPARPRRPARRRPPLHRPRLPAGDAGRRRDPAGRLRAGAVAALQPRLRRVDRHLGHRRRARPAAIGPRSRRARPPARCACISSRAPTPAARLRAFLRETGLPALLPEWGYGHWKSRDVYEHQRRRARRLRGLPRHDIPLDAIVIDSPWETQYNTWGFNPHQFPDAARAGRADARRRRAHRRLGDPLGQPRLERRPEPARRRVRAAAPRARAQLRRGRRGGSLRRAAADGEP